MKISRSDVFHRFLIKGPSLNLQENRTYKQNLYILWQYCDLQLETARTQTTILIVPWSRFINKFVFNSGNSVQLLRQVSECMKFWFSLFKFSKYTLLIKNLMTFQA